jgi:bifunctional ADP-heptose synthase (sugar kinase/adenylyltransferase)
MELKDKFFELIVGGDPIEDVWMLGGKISTDCPRFDASEVIKRPGGAANTYINAEALADTTRSVFVTTAWSTSAPPYRLIRLIAKDGLSTEFWSHTGESKEKMYFNRTPFWDFWTISPLRKKGLIISEYNKGMCSALREAYSPAFVPIWDNNWKFMIVDSRYRTCSTKLINSFPGVKIWHATGREYDESWANDHFDYVLQTDGSGPVNILSTQNPSAIGVVEVPVVQVVDEIGAGDTFTAAVGVFLGAHYQEEIDMALLERAAQYAIDCCRQVVQQKYTAIPTKPPDIMEY